LIRQQTSATMSQESFRVPANRVSRPFDLTEYLRARRAGSPGHAGFPSANWLKHLFGISSTLRTFGLDAEVFHGAMYSDAAKLDEACLQLLEKLVESRSIAKKERAASRRGLVAPEGLIRHLTLLLTEASHLEGLSPPEALVILLRELLGGANT